MIIETHAPHYKQYAKQVIRCNMPLGASRDKSSGRPITCIYGGVSQTIVGVRLKAPWDSLLIPDHLVVREYLTISKICVS
jgi:hypothetical protein